MASIAKITRFDTPITEKSNAAHNLATVSAHIPKLRSLANRLLERARLPACVAAVIELIQRCDRIDLALAFWSDNAPDAWKYTTAESMDMPDYVGQIPLVTCPGKIGVYRDVWVARTWNSYRTSRLYVQAIILRCVAWLSGTSVLELDDGNTDRGFTILAHRAKDVMQTMVDGICISVPSHTGYGQAHGPSPADQCLRSHAVDSLSTSDSVESLSDYHYKATPKSCTGGRDAYCYHEIGGYLLLWPLLVAGSAVFIPEDQKKWITSRVLEIGEHSGLNQAIMARMNERPGQPLFEVYGPIQY